MEIDLPDLINIMVQGLRARISPATHCACPEKKAGQENQDFYL